MRYHQKKYHSTRHCRGSKKVPDIVDASVSVAEVVPDIEDALVVPDILAW